MATETEQHDRPVFTLLDDSTPNLRLRLDQGGETKELNIGQVLQGVAFLCVTGDIAQVLDVLFELHRAIEPELFEEEDDE